MIAGTVAGAIGTGGIAGGILMAIKDPKVKSAATAFGDSISAQFFAGGQPFVQPIITSLQMLHDAFDDLDFAETFAKMAPHVTTIAGGLGDFARNIMPGLNKAFDRMGPFAAAAAEGFGHLGTAIGDFADDVTKSEGAVKGLEFTFAMLSGAITVTGAILRELSDAFDVYLTVMGNVAAVSERVFAGMPAIRGFFGG